MQCIICGKEVKGLKAHLKISHEAELAKVFQLRPELESLFNIASSKQIAQSIEEHEAEIQAALRGIKSPEAASPELATSSESATSQPAATEPPGEAPKSEPTNEFDKAVEQTVLKTLEKMQLGEAINKKMAEIETRLSQQITTPATSPLPPSNGNTQNTQLRDTILANLAQKLIGGDSPSSFEQMTKMLDMARAVADAFNKPVMEAQAYTRREISDTLKMLRDAGAAPNVARDTLIKRTEG